MLLSLKNCIYTSKLGLCVEFLGEFLHGIWHWYTSIKFRTTLKKLKFGWNSIQKMSFSTFV